MSNKVKIVDFINESMSLINEAEEAPKMVNGEKVTRFRGIFSKCDEENGNGRIYSQSLWDKVLADPKVQDKLTKKTMMGELKHPSYRDIDPDRSAFFVTKLWREGKYIMGEGEVFNNPHGSGGTLKVILAHGVQMGVSSRGEGSMIERGGKSYVDESDYELITFDMTVEPSVIEAFPPVVESQIQKELRAILESNTKLSSTAISLIESLTTKLSENSEPITTASKEPAMSDNTNVNESELRAVTSRLTEATNKLTEANAKLDQKDRTIKSLKTKIAEQRNQQLSLAEKTNDLVESYRKLNRNYGRALKIAEGIRREAIRKSAVSAKNEQKLRAQIKNRNAKLESDSKAKTSKLEANYAKALATISELSEAVRVEKSKNTRLSENVSRLNGKYANAVGILKEAEATLKESEIKTYLNRELAPLGGTKKFASLLGKVSTIAEAKKKVAEIKSLTEGKSNPKPPTKKNDMFNESGPKRRQEPLNENRDRGTSHDSDEAESLKAIFNLVN